MAADVEWIGGWHSVLAALEAAPERCLEVRFLKGREDERAAQVRALTEAEGIHCTSAGRNALDKQFKGNHQGIIARVRLEPQRGEADLWAFLDALPQQMQATSQGVATAPLLLVLDGVLDPHNLGACLRSANGAGVHGVIVPRNRSAPLTGVVRKIASGALESMNVFQVANLGRVLSGLKEQYFFQIVGASDDAPQSWYDIDYVPATAIVLGSEAEGMRRLTREHCDLLARIDMQGSVSSLNVSVASGVVLFEACRQRLIST